VGRDFVVQEQTVHVELAILRSLRRFKINTCEISTNSITGVDNRNHFLGGGGRLQNFLRRLLLIQTDTVHRHSEL